MREHHTYRNAKRGLCHPTEDRKRVYVDPDGIHHISPDAFALWRQGQHAARANTVAKLPERRKLVAQAHSSLAKSIVASPRTFTARDTIAVLREFYLKNGGGGRAMYRILHTELRAA
jgi:hypothetical protein